MTRLAILIAAGALAPLPGAALAHGLHGPVSDHAAAHAWPVLVLAAVAVVSLLVLRRARK